MSCRDVCPWGVNGCTRNVCPVDPLETQQAAAKVRHKQHVICPMVARVAGGGVCRDPDIDAAARLTVALVDAEAIGSIGYRKALDRAAACSRSGRLTHDALIERRAREDAFERNRVSAAGGAWGYIEALASDYGMDDDGFTS